MQTIATPYRLSDAGAKAVVYMYDPFRPPAIENKEICNGALVHDGKRLTRQCIRVNGGGRFSHHVLGLECQQFRIHMSAQITVGNDSKKSPVIVNDTDATKPFGSHDQQRI